MNLRRRLRALFRRRDLEAEMAEEMRFHLDQRAADLTGDGLDPAAARLAAQRKFGNTAALQEQSRDTFGWGALERFAQDLRFAARQLLHTPGYSLLAIVTLGLGIGANTSMFSLVNGIMLKPLPYAEPDRLQHIHRATPQNPEGDHSPADYLDLLKAQAGHGEFSAISYARVSLSDPGKPADLVFSGRASANLFSLLGVVPQLGRDFLPGEDTPGRDQVVILSHRVWHQRYDAAPDVIGRRIRIDGEWHEVVGVLPASFNDWRHLGNLDFIRPLAFTPEFSTDRKSTHLQIFGRIAPGVSPAEATAFIADFGARQARAHPVVHAGSSWHAVSLHSTAVGSSGGLILPMLIGLSGFVLLIACSNLANLLLARTIARAREFAVRAALGASTLQIIRPLLAEALLLSCAAGGLAIAVAHWFRDWMRARTLGDSGDFADFPVDWRVMGWAFVAALVTAVAFAVIPALHARRLDLVETLKSGGRGGTGSRGHQRFRQVLIVGQFTLAMILLSGAALFIRGLDELYHRRTGWQSAAVVTGTISLPAGTYGTREKNAAFQRLALERLGALPGVARVATATASPFFNWRDVQKFELQGLAQPALGQEPAAALNSISPDYLDVFGLQLVAGRRFLPSDDASGPRVYLVGQSTARAWFGEQDPIGRRIAVIHEGEPVWGEIVGIVADFQSVDPKRNPVAHRVYQPILQALPTTFDLAVQSRPGIAPASLVADIRTLLGQLDADIPIRRLQPADDRIASALYQLDVIRDVLAAFGVLGLALASLGVYGILTRTMAQRAGEFAVRLALGASHSDITRLVLGTGVRLSLIGAALGVVGAIGAARIITVALPGIRTDHPHVLAAAALTLTAAGLLACWLPARRASRVDALAALRAD